MIFIIDTLQISLDTPISNKHLFLHNPSYLPTIFYDGIWDLAKWPNSEIFHIL